MSNWWNFMSHRKSRYFIFFRRRRTTQKSTTMFRPVLLFGVTVFMSTLPPSTGRSDAVDSQPTFRLDVVVVSLCASLIVSSAAIYGICCWNRDKKVKSHGDVEATKQTSSNTMTVRRNDADPSAKDVTDAGTNHEPVTVKLVTGSSSYSYCGLGLNVCRDDKTGAIFVCEVLGNGPAKLCGKIRPGDRLLSLKVSTECMELEDAMMLLSYASPYPVELCIQPANDASKTSTELGHMSTAAVHDRNARLQAVRRAHSVRNNQTAELVEVGTVDDVDTADGDRSRRSATRSQSESRRDSARREIVRIESDQGLALFTRQPINTAHTGDVEVEPVSVADIPDDRRQKMMSDSAIDLGTDASTIDLSRTLMDYMSCELQAISPDFGWDLADGNDSDGSDQGRSANKMNAGGDQPTVDELGKTVGTAARQQEDVLGDLNNDKDPTVDENNNADDDRDLSVAIEINSEENVLPNEPLNNLLSFEHSITHRKSQHSTGSGFDSVSTVSSESPLTSSSTLPNEIDQSIQPGDIGLPVVEIHQHDGIVDVHSQSHFDGMLSFLPASTRQKVSEEPDTTDQLQLNVPLKSIDEAASEESDHALRAVIARDVTGIPSAAPADAAEQSSSLGLVQVQPKNSGRNFLPSVPSATAQDSSDRQQSADNTDDDDISDSSNIEDNWIRQGTFSTVDNNTMFYDINLNDEPSASASGEVTVKRQSEVGQTSMPVDHKRPGSSANLNFSEKWRNFWSAESLDRNPTKKDQRPIEQNQRTLSSDDIGQRQTAISYATASDPEVGEFTALDNESSTVSSLETLSRNEFIEVNSKDGDQTPSSGVENSSPPSKSIPPVGCSLDDTLHAVAVERSASAEKLETLACQSTENSLDSGEKTSEEDCVFEDIVADAPEALHSFVPESDDAVVFGAVDDSSNHVDGAAASSAAISKTWLESILRYENDDPAPTVCWTEVGFDPSTPNRNYATEAVASTDDISLSGLVPMTDQSTWNDYDQEDDDAQLFGAVKYVRQESSQPHTEAQSDAESSSTAASIEESDGRAIAESPLSSENVALSSAFDDMAVLETSSPPDDDVIVSVASRDVTTKATDVTMSEKGSEAQKIKEILSSPADSDRVDTSEHSATTHPSSVMVPPPVDDSGVSQVTTAASSNRTELEVRIASVDVKHVDTLLLPHAGKQLTLVTSDGRPTTHDRPSIDLNNNNNDNRDVEHPPTRVTSSVTSDDHVMSLVSENHESGRSSTAKVTERSRDDGSPSVAESLKHVELRSSREDVVRVPDGALDVAFRRPDTETDGSRVPVDHPVLDQPSDDKELYCRDIVRQYSIEPIDLDELVAPSDDDADVADEHRVAQSWTIWPTSATSNIPRASSASSPPSSLPIEISELTVMLKRSRTSGDVISSPSRISLRRRPRRRRIVSLTVKKAPQA